MMPRILKNCLRVAGWVAGVIVSLLAVIGAVCFFLHATVDMKEPAFEPSDEPVAAVGTSLRWKESAFRRNPAGLWEMKVQGSAFERGEAMGKLALDLLYYQEKAFADELFTMVPNKVYRKFLYWFISIFNRDLGENVPLEYRQEIKAMSAACTHEFDDFGTPYERQMQYHSAHDIGHVMQDYMLVACTSFAAWGAQSADSSLIIARNFDFYMGEDFARNKLVLFEKPDSGYAFVSVTWPGMTGVLSGMNTEGLTVTINAAKLETPGMSATPISILAKRILQYASTIDEAYRIAGEYRTFVSESLLIGSANDGRAAIIEKAPSEMDIFDPARSDSSVMHVTCTNHYQSDLFRDNPVNQDNIKMSDSMCRFRRVEELLDSVGRVDTGNAALILRDMRGEGGADIGYCNDLAINQLLAMHSVIFRPAERKIWVSTWPWQCGKFVCYDLNKALEADFSEEITIPEEEIPASSFVHSPDFDKVKAFKKLQKNLSEAVKGHRQVSPDSLQRFENLNPGYYLTYDMLGDYYMSAGENQKAEEWWRKSLTYSMKEMERRRIAEKLQTAE